MNPSIGRIVLYRLTADDADKINQRRQDADDNMPRHRQDKTGAQIHVGNHVYIGDEFPMIITHLWGDGPEACFNGSVFLDGNDLFWATSVSLADYDGRVRWPPKP